MRASSCSRLDHRLIATRAKRRACPGRAAALLDVHAVILGELAHRRADDRRRGQSEPAEREFGHVIAELIEPLEVLIAAELALHALEDPLHARCADAARDADAAGLLREI